MRSKSLELMLRIKDFIESYYERYSSTPTVREISASMKICCTNLGGYFYCYRLYNE